MTDTTLPTPTTAPPVEWAPTGTLTIETVSDHWHDLRAHLDDPRGVHLHLDGITRVDTAGVQLLLQARQMAADTQRTLLVGGLVLRDDVRQFLGVPDALTHTAAPATPATTGQEG